MTIYHVDFPSGQLGRYGLDGPLTSKIFATQSWLYNDPRPGQDGVGVVWGVGQGINDYMIYNLPDVLGRFVFSFRLYTNGLPDSNDRAPFFRLWEDQDNIALDVRLRTDGSLGPNGDCAIVSRAWQLVEIMFGAGAGHAGIEIRVDGRTVFAAATGGTIHRPDSAPPIYQFKIISSGAPHFITIKDFVLQGNTNADFIGPCNVRELLPASDISSGWNKTGGTTDFGILDTAPPDVAHYISAPDPIPAASVTTLAGLHANTKAIHGLYSSIYMLSPDGGAVQASLVQGTARAGAVNNPAVVGTFYRDNFTLDPATGLPWTVAVVSALRLSVNRTA